MSDDDKPSGGDDLGPWVEHGETVEAVPQPEERRPRPPALTGWIGVACLIVSGASYWTHDQRPGVVGIGLSAAMLTAGAALVFVLVRRFFVPPEKDGRT